METWYKCLYYQTTVNNLSNYCTIKYVSTSKNLYTSNMQHNTRWQQRLCRYHIPQTKNVICFLSKLLILFHFYLFNWFFYFLMYSFILVSLLQTYSNTNFFSDNPLYRPRFSFRNLSFYLHSTAEIFFCFFSAVVFFLFAAST